MVRFSSILIVYFLLGAIMWGGGAITWSEAGVADYLVEDPSDGDVEGSEEVSDDVTNLGGPIQNLTNSLGGGLVAIWNFISKLIGSIFWPITVLQANGAPTQVTVVLGGGLSISFVAAVIQIIGER